MLRVSNRTTNRREAIMSKDTERTENSERRRFISLKRIIEVVTSKNRVRTENRQRRKFVSLRRILLGVLALVGGVAVAVVHGGLGEVGRAIVQKSETIQHTIQAIQRKIEEWIPH
jgi:hypothetical protein